MKDLESEAKVKFSKRAEPRFISGLSFLSEAVAKCAERAKLIETYSNVKELEAALKEVVPEKAPTATTTTSANTNSSNPSTAANPSTPITSLRFCGFVDMSIEIVERITALKKHLEQ
jgi:hypothetical protein